MFLDVMERAKGFEPSTAYLEDNEEKIEVEVEDEV